MADLQNSTFSLTKEQIDWIEKQSQKTGLAKADIVRRAIDEYAEAQQSKERRELFTREQREAIREVARMRGVSEKEVVQEATKKECRFYDKLDKDRKRNLTRNRRDK